MMKFEQAKNEYLRLKSQMESKQISALAFEDAVNKINVTDSLGRYWTIGAESGKWYRLKGSSWVEDTPPIQPVQKKSRSAWLWPVIAAAASLCIISLVIFGRQLIFKNQIKLSKNEQIAASQAPSLAPLTEEVNHPTPDSQLPSSATTEPTAYTPTTESDDAGDLVDESDNETASAKIPEVPLSPEGPWVVFLANDGIWALNQDGSGLTHMVDGIVMAPSDLSAGVNGSTLAFVTADDAFSLQNLTLKLLKLPEGTVETITPLLAPENQPGDSPDICDPQREAARAVTIYNSLAWSPDGNQLGFIGAMEGPTADLYLYTPNDGTITRLTDGPSQAHSVNWTRSGEYIVHFGASCFGTGAGFNMDGVWASDVETGDVITLYQPSTESYGEEFVANYWSEDDAIYVITHSGCPARDLRLVDIQSQEITMVHEGCFWDYAVYPPEIIAVLDGPDFSGHPGLHLYSAENFKLLNYIFFENGHELNRYENMFLVKSIDYDQPLPTISSVNIHDGSIGWYQGYGDFPQRGPGTDYSYSWLEGDNFYFLSEGEDQPILLSDQGASYPFWLEDFGPEGDDLRMHLLYFAGGESDTLYIAKEPDFIPIPISDGLMPQGDFTRIWPSE